MTQDDIQDHRINALENALEQLKTSHQNLNDSVIKLNASVKAISTALEDIKGFVIKLVTAVGAGGVTVAGIGGVIL